MPFDIFLKVSEAFKIYFKPVFLSVLSVGFLLLYLLLSPLAFCFPILSFLAWLLLHIIFPLLQGLWGFWGAGAQYWLSGAEGQRGWREGLLEANKWCHLCSESMAPGAGRTQHKFLPGERQTDKVMKPWWRGVGLSSQMKFSVGDSGRRGGLGVWLVPTEYQALD